MDFEEIKETDEWSLYEIGRKYLTQINAYTDTDTNYRMFNGDQWYGLKVKGIEKVQYNFIKPIVDYKTANINQNLWAINFSSDNFDKDFRKRAEEVCDMLNRKSAQVWEREQMDHFLRVVSEDAAVNSEGIMYVDYDEKLQSPKMEVLNKCDVMYGNENTSDIQKQPYILIKRRVSILEAIELAKLYGVEDSKLSQIMPEDADVYDESGEMAKIEVNNDDKVTILTKLYRGDSTVHFSMATRYVQLKDDTDTGLNLYPLAHFVWREKKGSARGEGEVKNLIPNQLEVNKTLMRTLMTIKNTAFPQKVVNMSRILNPDAINQTGGILKYDGIEVDDVRKMFSVTQPATMSSDVWNSLNGMISNTRNLANAGDAATGGINPEQASGRAILAVQQASAQPLIFQQSALKKFVEDVAKIWIDMWITNDAEMVLQKEVEDPQTGLKQIIEETVQPYVLEKLKINVRIDVTPVSAFDRFAQEQSLENLLIKGFFNPQRYAELKVYADALPDNSVMPKQRLLDICASIEANQQKIAVMEQQAQMMQQNIDAYLNMDKDTQDAMMGQFMA